MRFCLFFFALLPSFGHCNPVASAIAKKTWERCLVAMDKNTAHVSCAIGYRVTDSPNEFWWVTVPTFVPTEISKEALPQTLAAKLEFSGGQKVHSPINYSEGRSENAPPGTRLVICVFSFPKPPSNNFSLVVSYQQPLQNGKFYYLPLFEKGEQPKDLKEFTLSAFPIGSSVLKLIEPNNPDSRELATRITVTPKHDQMIAIELK